MIIAATASQAYDISGTVYAVLASLAILATLALWLGRRFWRKVDEKLASMDKKATPNGGDTLELGDTAARIENKVDGLNSALMYHLQHHPGPSNGWSTSPPAPVSAPQPTRKEIEATVGEAGR